ncbi:acyltransferase-domain-containing protein [Neohortaea acidophila]|uniref:Acyltransferase-domain-containing protein n=1 Tax=Neohortaea acidophila TaxID=245834 RepID=A0A6A6PU35_9PEZI|nr:acyltransferase-domain-containing protein [Neohortaea acidophila]KAF2483201.1 acyltransferase-domain-containing protein [Neohortaea acidophila]
MERPTSERSLLEPYARFRGEPLIALQELGLHFVGEGWRSYDDVVGREIFYSGFSENMRNMVMRQETLKRQITLLANKRVEVELLEGRLGPLGVDGEDAAHKLKRETRRAELETQLRQVAEDWTDKMICKMESRYFIRGAYYFATQLLTRAYHQGIHISTEEVLHLRKVAEEAAERKQSIIFLPCHRSHVDYVSLQLVCYRLGLALPTVVAGDNLNFPLVGSFLQHAGAMWIRRSFGDDHLYPTLVQAYMDTLLQNGHNVECFVEGGRSRTGKLLQPKFGILRFFLESVLSGRVEDAMICPVSTQYDKVIEVDSYVSELLGQPKQREDLRSFVSASNVLSLKLGRVDVRFFKPWSLRAFIDERMTRLERQPAAPGALPGETLRRRLLQTLGYEVLSNINEVSVVMPTALVGTVLLTLRGRGVGKSELVRRVEWLCDRVRARGGRVAHFAGNSTELVVDRAVEVLGPKIVGRVGGLAQDTFYAEDRFLLSFYRNQMIHLFISQALVCAAVYTKVKNGGTLDEQRITYQELEDYVFFLSQLFRAEFIFPTTPLEENLRSTVQGLEQDGVLQVIRNNTDDAQRITHVELHPHERTHGHENFDFYNFLLWPFTEAAWLGAVSLFMLVPPPQHHQHPSGTPAAESQWLNQQSVQDKAQLLGKTLFHQGDLAYYEAVNKEALKNTFTRSEEAGIIVVNRSGDSSTKSNSPARVRLDDEWMPSRDANGALRPEGKLWELCERIGLSRRGGLDWRDGDAVRGRILGLVDGLGAGLWEGGALLSADGRPSVSRRRRGIQTLSHL